MRWLPRRLRSSLVELLLVLVVLVYLTVDWLLLLLLLRRSNVLVRISADEGLQRGIQLIYCIE